MSLDRADHYPEVSTDETGLVPHQDEAEWPKKIRTLSAGELDRLTIDDAGRFYWDGRLVNYQAPEAPIRAETPASEPAPEPSLASRSRDAAARDLDAMAILDRAAQDLSGLHAVAPPSEPVAEAPAASPASAAAPPAEQPLPPPVAEVVETVAPATTLAVAPVALAATEAAPVVARLELAEQRMPVRTRPERLRVVLSAGQCAGLALVVLALLVGAAGLTAQGLVAAHEWGCRAGMLHTYCPAPPPAPKPLASADIPA
jgi:hypothetical protein